MSGVGGGRAGAFASGDWHIEAGEGVALDELLAGQCLGTNERVADVETVAVAGEDGDEMAQYQLGSGRTWA